MKLLVCLAVVAALAAGFLVGRFQAGRAWDRGYNAGLVAFTMSEARRSAADFSHTAGLLQTLRSGDTNEAIETLENDLDSHILVIGYVVGETPVAERDRQLVSRIRWLRNYRATQPRATTNALAEDVTHVLSLLDTNR